MPTIHKSCIGVTWSASADFADFYALFLTDNLISRQTNKLFFKLHKEKINTLFNFYPYFLNRICYNLNIYNK